jgi:hypothetical protein
MATFSRQRIVSLVPSYKTAECKAPAHAGAGAGCAFKMTARWGLLVVVDVAPPKCAEEQSLRVHSPMRTTLPYITLV